MTDKGAAYIIMLPTMQMLPTMAALFLGSWTKVRTTKPSATTKIISTMTIIITFILCLRSEYNKNSVRYTISMPRPVPLIVITKRLLGVTHGRPYITQSPQLINVARYGIGENCSTDLLFHIRTKVVLSKKKSRSQVLKVFFLFKSQINQISKSNMKQKVNAINK